MTPQQRNDYSFLPEHPAPMSAEVIELRMEEAIIWLPEVYLDWRHWLAVIAVAFFACMGGWMLHGQVSHHKLSESFNAGLKIGAICAHDPMMAACSDENMSKGGVL